MRHMLLIFIFLIITILPVSAQESSELMPITIDNVAQLHEITSFTWANEDTIGTRTNWNPINGRILIHEFRGRDSDYQPTVTVWDSLEDQIIFQQPLAHGEVNWNEDGTRLLISEQKDDAMGIDLALWSIDTGELIAEFEHTIPEFLMRHEILWLDDQIYVSTATSNWGEDKTEDSIGTYLSVFDTQGNLLNTSTSEWLSNYLIPSPDETRIFAFMETSVPGQHPIILDRDGNIIAELDQLPQPTDNTIGTNPYAVWSADSQRILTFTYPNVVRYNDIWHDATDPRLWTADGELITQITTPYDDYRDGIMWNDDLTRFFFWNGDTYPESTFFAQMVNDNNEIMFELPEDSTLNNEDNNRLHVTWNPDQSLLFLWQYQSHTQKLLEIWSNDGELILQTDRDFDDLNNAIWSTDNRRFLLPIEQFSRDCILENVVLELWDMQDLTRPQARMLYTGFLNFFWNADESLIYGRVGGGFIWDGCSFSPERELVIWNNDGDRLFEAPIMASDIELNIEETQLFVRASGSVAIWGVTDDD